MARIASSSAQSCLWIFTPWAQINLVQEIINRVQVLVKKRVTMIEETKYAQAFNACKHMLRKDTLRYTPTFWLVKFS